MGARIVLERRFRTALLQGRRAGPWSFAECRNFTRRCAVVDLVLPGLVVKGAYTGVEFQRVGLQLVELADVARADINALGRGAAEIAIPRREVGTMRKSG